MPNQDKSVFIRGIKTVLRPVLRSDLPNLIRWINDPELRHFISGYLPMMEANEEEWLKRLAEDRSNLVFIVETLQGEPIGTMGLHHINLKDRNATTGAMFDKKFCGLGLGTDAKLYLLEYCFMELNLHRVVSSVIEYNKRSLRYSLRCGYKIEGRSKEEVFKEGKYRDVIHLAIFRKDWERVFNRYLKTGRVR